jgi:hypothetical protein
MESATKKKKREKKLCSCPASCQQVPPTRSSHNNSSSTHLLALARSAATVRGRHGRVPPRRPAARPRRRRKPPLPPSLSCPSPLPPPPPQPAPSQFASSPSLRRYPRFRSARPPAEVRVRGCSILARRGSRGLFDLLARRGFGPVIRSSFVASVASSASALDAA